MNKLGDQFRVDINHALDIWRELIDKYGNVEYAYAKGSAIKKWESDIDYVPFVSDVDIHIKSTGDNIFPAEYIWQIPDLYEKQFIQNDHNHIPRINIKDIEELKALPGFIGLTSYNIQILNGQPPPPIELEASVIRDIDKARLKEIIDFYPKIPEMISDRIKIEYWLVLRKITWRIAPTPVRLLTQIDTDIKPLELWDYNRTQIVNRLQEYDLNKIANHYIEFYEKGWKLYCDNFSSSSIYLDTIKTAFELFREIDIKSRELFGGQLE